MVGQERGLTLIELMVTLAIMVFLLLVGVPFTASWAQSASVNDARSKLNQGFGMARALAQRNPNGTRLPTVAAGIKVDSTNVLVCLGDPAAGACAKDGAAMKWQSSLPANTTVVIGVAETKLGFDNTGMPLADTAFTISNGSVSETGSLH